jgi:Fur family ferric uptake transcriptional regulator
MTPKLTSQTVTTVRADIRSAGLRATPARIATLKLLRESSAPLTHAEVAAQVAGLAVDKATAFRNLNDLSEAGLLRRTELGDHVWRFEATDPGQRHDQAHPHFLCVDCGMVTCMQQVRLTAGSRRESAAVGQVTEILLRGHCNDCR